MKEGGDQSQHQGRRRKGSPKGTDAPVGDDASVSGESSKGKKPHTESASTAKKEPIKRCGALTGKGEPCQGYCITGSDRCKLHGGIRTRVHVLADSTYKSSQRKPHRRAFFGLPDHIMGEIDERAREADITDVRTTLALSEQIVAHTAAPIYNADAVRTTAKVMRGSWRDDSDDAEPSKADEPSDAEIMLARAKLSRAVATPLAEHGRLQMTAAKLSVMQEVFERAIVPCFRELGDAMRHILMSLGLPGDLLSRKLEELDAAAVEVFSRMEAKAEIDSDVLPVRLGADDTGEET